jgi:MraZ protein
VAFRGTFEQKLDAKNRLTIPARFRTQLEGELVLVRPPDLEPCIWVLGAAEYDAFVEESLAGHSPMSIERLEGERSFYGRSSAAELDSAGRIVLPASMMRSANLDRDVAVVGSGPRLELWEPQAWEALAEPMANRIRQMTARASHAA